MAIVAMGAFCDLVGSIGLLRFPNFFVRLHAATVGTIGGAAYPLMGVALMALACDFLGAARWSIAAGSALTSIIVVLTAPAGSHALARAAHRSGVPVEPKVCDLLEEDRRGGGR
ncbi:cation:proton antiporter [Candidatus Geothermarchaeota archaeon ex4572_27]|nr:MAG: cation:proton antiporter [Candidatus Geothermarchaeota archaeon ex4572_27]